MLGADEKLKKVNEALNAYEQSRGIPLGIPHNEGAPYLNLSKKELLAMSEGECKTAATLLSQFSYHVQKALNEEKAVVNWCNTEINRAVLQQTNQYQGGTAEERKAKAIHENEYTRQLDKLRAQAQARVDRLEYLPNRIDGVRIAITDMATIKERRGE